MAAPIRSRRAEASHLPRPLRHERSAERFEKCDPERYVERSAQTVRSNRLQRKSEQSALKPTLCASQPVDSVRFALVTALDGCRRSPSSSEWKHTARRSATRSVRNRSQGGAGPVASRHQPAPCLLTNTSGSSKACISTDRLRRAPVGGVKYRGGPCISGRTRRSGSRRLLELRQFPGHER